MNANTDENKTTPWYRVGMVWMAIGLPLAVVVASLVTVTIAYQNSPTIIQPPVLESRVDKAG